MKKYLAQILACRRVKDPVKLYISAEASVEHSILAEDLFTTVTKELQKKHRAYLSTYQGFGGDRIVYAKEVPTKGEKLHETWHRYITRRKADSSQGEFIEEACDSVLEHIVTGGDYNERAIISRKQYVPLFREIQKSTASQVESMLKSFGGWLPEWDEKVMEGSCNWLRFIDDAQYLLLYGLCLDVCLKVARKEKGIKDPRKIYARALETAKKYGTQRAVNYLRRHASGDVAELYNLDFSDLGRYYPSYPGLAKANFFNGGIKIEAYGKYPPWIAPLEREIRKRKLVQDKKSS